MAGYDSTLSGQRVVDAVEKVEKLAKVATSGSYADLSGKPTIPTTLAGLTDDSTHRTVTDTEKATWNAKSNFSGSYNDLTNKPTIPAEQVNADWNATSGKAQILNKPTIPTVPTKVSEFENDAKYITAQTAQQTYQPKGDYALKSELTDNVAYPMENHTEATLEIAPNVMHVLGEMAALTVTLGAEVEGVVNEYVFQFSSGATATTLTMPSDLVWANGEALVPEASKTYQVSIVNGYAVYSAF